MESIKSRRQSLINQKRQQHSLNSSTTAIASLDLSSPSDLYNFYLHAQSSSTYSAGMSQSLWSNWRLRRRKTFADPQLLLAQNLPDEGLFHNLDTRSSSQGIYLPTAVRSTTVSDWIKSLSPPTAGVSGETDSFHNAKSSLAGIFESYYTSIMAYTRLLTNEAHSVKNGSVSSVVESGDDNYDLPTDQETNEQRANSSVKRKLNFSVEVILGM